MHGWTSCAFLCRAHDILRFLLDSLDIILMRMKEKGLNKAYSYLIVMSFDPYLILHQNSWQSEKRRDRNLSVFSAPNRT